MTIYKPSNSSARPCTLHDSDTRSPDCDLCSCWYVLYEVYTLPYGVGWLYIYLPKYCFQAMAMEHGEGSAVMVKSTFTKCVRPRNWWFYTV